MKKGVWHSKTHGRTAADPPRTIQATGSFSRQVPADTACAEFREPSRTTFPLLPDGASQAPSNPRVQILQYRGPLGEAEVCTPSGEIACQFLDHLLDADSPMPTGQFPDSLPELCQCLRGNDPLRHFGVREAESQELSLPA